MMRPVEATEGTEGGIGLSKRENMVKEKKKMKLEQFRKKQEAIKEHLTLGDSLAKSKLMNDLTRKRN